MPDDGLMAVTPKNWKPIVGFMIFAGSIIGAFVLAQQYMSGLAVTAAAAQVSVVAQKQSDHEREDDGERQQVLAKLDAIQTSVNETSRHVAKIDQWIDDVEADDSYAGPRHHAAPKAATMKASH